MIRVKLRAPLLSGLLEFDARVYQSAIWFIPSAVQLPTAAEAAIRYSCCIQLKVLPSPPTPCLGYPSRLIMLGPWVPQLDVHMGGILRPGLGSFICGKLLQPGVTSTSCPAQLYDVLPFLKTL